MVWYSHLFKSFPQFIMIHRVKGFSLANETEVDVVLEFPCFLYDPENVDNLISGSSAFSRCSMNIWNFWVHIILKRSLEELSITLIAWEMSATVQWLEHSLVLPYLGIGTRIDLFLSSGHCWLFQIF